MENRTLRPTRVFPPVPGFRHPLAYWQRWLQEQNRLGTKEWRGLMLPKRLRHPGGDGLRGRLFNAGLLREDNRYTEDEIRSVCAEYLPRKPDDRHPLSFWQNLELGLPKPGVMQKLIAHAGMSRPDELYTQGEVLTACAELLDGSVPAANPFSGFVTLNKIQYASDRTWARYVRSPGFALALRKSGARTMRVRQREAVGSFYAEPDVRRVYTVLTGDELPRATMNGDLAECIVVDGVRYAPDYVWAERPEIDVEELRRRTQFWRPDAEQLPWIIGIPAKGRLMRFYAEDVIRAECGLVTVRGLSLTRQEARLVELGILTLPEVS